MSKPSCIAHMHLLSHTQVCIHMHKQAPVFSQIQTEPRIPDSMHSQVHFYTGWATCWQFCMILSTHVLVCRCFCTCLLTGEVRVCVETCVQTRLGAKCIGLCTNLSVFVDSQGGAASKAPTQQKAEQQVLTGNCHPLAHSSQSHEH